MHQGVSNTPACRTQLCVVVAACCVVPLLCTCQSAFDNLSIGDGDNANGAEGGGGRKLLKRPGRANVIKRYLARGLGDLAQKVFLAMVAFRCGDWCG